MDYEKEANFGVNARTKAGQNAGAISLCEGWAKYGSGTHQPPSKCCACQARVTWPSEMLAPGKYFPREEDLSNQH
jgi:hypothetical protein